MTASAIDAGDSRRGQPRVVIVDYAPALTGAFRCAARMATLLAPHARFDLVLPRASQVPAAELAPFGAVDEIPLTPLRRSPTSLPGYAYSVAAGGGRLARLLAERRADVLVLNDFNQMQGAVARALGFRGRIVTWVRFDPSWFPRPLAQGWLGIDYRVSDAVVAVSDFIARQLPRDPKTRRIYDAIDSGMQANARPDPAARNEIVYVGNYIPGKGQDAALEAFGRIAPMFPQASLRFYGGDMGLEKNRAYRRDLEARAQEVAPGQVRFHGFTADLPKALAGAIAAVNLSRSESFSLTCLEAGQLGVPVIAYRSGGPEEIVVHERTGFLLPIDDVAGVADRMRQLLSAPEEAADMGQGAAAHVRERFGPDAYISAVRDVLKI